VAETPLPARADVIVVGAGVGGLCAAVRLAAAGRSVLVLERNDEPGGKLAVRERDGFWFDTGPSLVTLPGVFAEVLALAGLDLHTELDLVRLDPPYRYHWADGTALDVADEVAVTAANVERFSPGSGAAYRGFVEHAGRIWSIAERTFLAGAMDRPREALRRLRSPRDLTGIDPFRTLHAAATARFRDERLVQWAGRYATYSGSSPYRAPATLACIAHVEAAYGCWYPMGGLGALRDALVRAALKVGVEVRCGVEVASLDAADGERGAVGGVVTTDGSRVHGTVVANVDAVHLYRDLLGDRRALRRVRRAEPSGSGFVVLAGVRGTTQGLAHHNIWFSPSYRAEYDALDAGRPSDEPTIYACVSSVTDPSQAPAGHENWFLLVNVPPAPLADPDAYASLVLDRLAARGVDLRDRLVFTELVTPADIERRYRAVGGAIYGTSSNGRRAAFVRPGNRARRPGLYLVGGSSHPGGGLPLVATSGRIVADLVLAEAR
jgi:phytoene desaturase